MEALTEHEEGSECQQERRARRMGVCAGDGTRRGWVKERVGAGVGARALCVVR